MAVLEPRYSKEEFAWQGQTIYERDIRPHLGAGDDGKFVAIDIETGAYELDRDDYTATGRLLSRHPHAQIWLLRVGQRTAYHLIEWASMYQKELTEMWDKQEFHKLPPLK
jgi:hypothetical protein